MRRLKIGINGFGRIGRVFTRIATRRNSFDIVTINTRKTPSDLLAYLLKYDSTYRTFDHEVTHDTTSINIDGRKIITTQAATPDEIPWDQYGVDLVIDATGAFTKKGELMKHVKGSVQKVILTAPAKDESIPHVVLGVNDDKIDWKREHIFSNCSCTTNCVAPMFKVLNDKLNILVGYLSTTHAYTQSQSLQDDANKTPDRSRAAPINIIPSTTGAATAVVRVLPELSGKIDGMAVRVPVATGSFSDLSVIVEKKTTTEEVNQLFKEATESSLKNIMQYETTQLVSTDYIGSPYSCIFDANYTKVLNGHLVKVFGWYDNEWGYSSRLVDLVERIAEKGY